jgi:predicted RNA-binding Zn-ribbon protein involved in translation (DUF1610 family)/DNA-directed RNA polymerase subunit RPC12/RpoP
MIEAMKQARDFISRLKFADAEPEPEIVMAVLDQAIAEAEKQERFFCERCGKRLSGGIHTCTPPAEAEKQEPVCPYCHDSHTLGAVYYDQNCVGCVKRMTATPPQREWVDVECPLCGEMAVAHTHPNLKNREWVGMTYEEIMQALEALESERDKYLEWGDKDGAPEDVYEAITTLRTAIEEADKQEPVAFKIYKPTPPRHAIPNVRDAELPWVYDQDPSSGNVASMWVTPVRTHPPKREWVGLTDEEIKQIAIDTPIDGMRFARALEAKLKEKNT